MTDPLDRHVVQCNYAQATKVAARGARAYVVLTNPGSGHDRIQVFARSRGGRWVLKWEPIRYLVNFREKTIPPEHPLYFDEQLWEWEPGETARALNEARAAAMKAKDD